MSNIASGPGGVSGVPYEVAAARASPPPASTTVPAQPVSTATQALPALPALVATTALAAGAQPVDAARVSSISRAIERGQYPLVPARIGDAMIAAGMLLRIAK